MEFRSRSKRTAELNLTPLIDVIFLLLLFFIIGSQFTSFKQMQVQLPSAKTPTTDLPKTALTLYINKNNRVLFRDKPISIAQAAQLLRKEGKSKEPQLLLLADGKATHQAVISVMDLAQKQGVLAISLGTTKAIDHKNNK